MPGGLALCTAATFVCCASTGSSPGSVEPIYKVQREDGSAFLAGELDLSLLWVWQAMNYSKIRCVLTRSLGRDQPTASSRRLDPQGRPAATSASHPSASTFRREGTTAP